MSRRHLQPLLGERPEAASPPSAADLGSLFIVAVIQNRANEVGLAALDGGSGTLWLGQYVESTRSYAYTLMMLGMHPPSALLVVANKDCVADTGLNAALHEYPLLPLPRKMFDDTEGMVLVQTCASADSEAALESSRGSYLAFGAAGALLKHMQGERGMALAAGALLVRSAEGAHHMKIDAASAEALELVQALAVGSSGRRGGTSLFKLLNGTRTRAGAQLLRANLLQPLRDEPTLTARYDALAELQADADLAFSLDECLKQLPKNMDGISAMIQSFMALRELLRTLSALAEALAAAESALLCTVHATATAQPFADLLARLDALLDEDAAPSRSAFLNRTQQCFALKGGVDALLDVSRHAFCRTTEQVHELAAELRQRHSLPGLRVQYTSRRGFYLVGLLEEVSRVLVLQYLPSLHRLVDGLALADMLSGFAHQLGATGLDYCRPVLTGAGPLALVECRHAVLEAADPGRPFQPNDAWLALDASLHIITGPNMSGKSTYLRAVALAVVMAQVGCFVPARFASLTPCDRLLTRIGTSDRMESNSSSFMVEMRETAYLLRHATPRSLILIDELGRATSTADGIGIAWAVGEALAASGALALFATHFGQLAELAVALPNCRACHFSVDASSNRLDFSWKLGAGAGEAGHYGLALASHIGFPSAVLQRAGAVVEALDRREQGRLKAYTSGDQGAAAAVWGLAGKLACVVQAFADAGDEQALMQQLRQLQREAEETFTAPEADVI